MRAPSRPGDPHLKELFRARIASIALAGLSALACGSPPRPPPPPPKVAARPAPARPPPPPAPPPQSEVDAEVAARLKAGVEYGPWQDLGHWAHYMAPTKPFVAADGGVDIAFHFHGGEVAEKDWRETGLNALIVSLTFPGWGNVPYKHGFSDPIRFGEILDEALKRVGATHVRRLLLVSWSAGYAAMGLVLANAHYYTLADTAIVLDGLHADYIDGRPDERPLTTFEAFARDAVAGEKTMIVVHSSIVPTGYASTTQMAELLCAAVGARRVEEERRTGDGPIEWYHSDAGGLHVRGFRGIGPKDHLDQLHLLDDLVREHVTPRWTRLAILDAKKRP